MRLYLIIFLTLTFLGPLSILLSGIIDFKADYQTANRASAKIAPDPAKIKEAVIQVYAARTFNWRGIFAVHTWIAIKPKDAKEYTTYQVIGWRLYRKLSALVTMEDVPDRLWFNQRPDLILDVRGDKAEQLIPKIKKAVAAYPRPDDYHYWPGPNSNSFTAYIGREVPALRLMMPSNAVGKDYLFDHFIARTPSGTGYQFSIDGFFGIALALKEGMEINILGLVYGFNPLTLTLKLPGFGDIHPWPTKSASAVK